MIPEIKKILFTTDLSENARYAFSYAGDIAARYNAGIVILHVLEDLPNNAEMIKNMLGEKEWEELKKKSEEEAVSSLTGKITDNKLIRLALRSLGEQISDDLLPDEDDQVEIVVQKGNIVEEIIAQSESKGCGMILMAYRSRNMLAESIIGGVCRKVLRRSKKPVLLVPMPDKS